MKTIMNPREIMLVRLSLNPTMANFGGDNKTDSSTKTTSNTTNWTDYNDQRVVGQDEAIGLSGNNSTVNRTTSNLTSFIDTSNRSTNFADSSDRSTQFTDNSDRSTNYTTTDHGAVAAGLGMGTKALDTVGLTMKQAFDSLTVQSENGLKATHAAFDLAKSSGANSMANSAAVLGFATDAIKETRAAFQEAEDGGNKQIMLYAVMAVAAVGIAVAVRR